MKRQLPDGTYRDEGPRRAVPHSTVTGRPGGKTVAGSRDFARSGMHLVTVERVPGRRL